MSSFDYSYQFYSSSFYQVFIKCLSSVFIEHILVFTSTRGGSGGLHHLGFPNPDPFPVTLVLSVLPQLVPSLEASDLIAFV
jgi:hypothetical protein